MEDRDPGKHRQIRRLRQRIDAIDDGIARLLNDRARHVLAIGAVKKKDGYPVYSPGRERDILDRLTRGNQGPLPDAAVRRLFERVIDESRSLERLYRDGAGSDPDPDEGGRSW